MNQFYYLECKYKLLFAKIVHKFFEIYKVISNYLHLNAGNASSFISHSNPQASGFHIQQIFMILACFPLKM